MASFYILIVLVLSVIIIEVKSKQSISYRNDGQKNFPQDYVRIKRAKYYSGPPQKFYRRPPTSQVFSGPFSYTPPPSYAMEMDDSPPYPGNVKDFRNVKPSYEGLGEDDINNIVKHLSKKDLNKFFELANDKPIGYSNRPETFNNNYKTSTVSKPPGFKDYNPNDQYKNQQNEIDIEEEINPNMIKYIEELSQPKIMFANPTNTQTIPNIYKDYRFSQPPLGYNEVNTNNNNINNPNSVFTDSSVMQEEVLPKPLNLREDIKYEISDTKPVPTFVKPDSMYRLGNFASLPLMDYNSKLHTVSSYHVPRYTVTQRPPDQQQPLNHQPQSSIRLPQVEAAPPISAAKLQSEANLKAIKIWTHQSKGTAYTLHDDGSLSLERPKQRSPF